MRIEKISDNQIRCTLTQADLAEHQVKLSELAFGTEKAKLLFHEMMQQAAAQHGFIVDNMPLMIEAIPSLNPNDTLTLIITKVDNPDEVDRRMDHYEKFSQDEPGKFSYEGASKLAGADGLMSLLERIHDRIEKSQKATKASTQNLEGKENQSSKAQSADASEDASDSRVRLFSFSNLDHVIAGSKLLKGMYDGVNTLYKDTQEDVYVLAMTISDYSVNEFNRICNMMTEYGTAEKSAGSMLAFLEEHCVTLVKKRAVQELSKF